MTSADEYVTVATIAKRLNISQHTVLRAIGRGDLIALRFGSGAGYRIAESDLAAWLATLRTQKGKGTQA